MEPWGAMVGGAAAPSSAERKLASGPHPWGGHRLAPPQGLAFPPKFQFTSSSGSLTSTHRFFFSSQTICHDCEKERKRSAGRQDETGTRAHGARAAGRTVRATAWLMGSSREHLSVPRHNAYNTHRFVLVIWQISFCPFFPRKPTREPGFTTLNIKTIRTWRT